MRLKKTGNSGGKGRKYRTRITKPGSSPPPKPTAEPRPTVDHMLIAAPQPIRLPKRLERLGQRIKQAYESGHALAAEAMAAEAAEAADRTLFDPGIVDTSTKEPTQPKAKAKAKTTFKAKAKAKAVTVRPPHTAGKKQVETDRIDELLKNPAWVRKELARLNALISKMTASSDKVTPKVHYIDEKQLAIRWGMSVKHIRNLRSAGVGPKVTYFGRSVRYRLRYVMAFEKANAFASPTDRDQSR